MSFFCHSHVNYFLAQEKNHLENDILAKKRSFNPLFFKIQSGKASKRHQLLMSFQGLLEYVNFEDEGGNVHELFQSCF